jgi:hypothetical protein
MASETETAEKGAAADAAGGRQRTRGGLRRLISSMMRLVDVQFRIMMVRAKLTLVRIAIFVALFAGMLVLGLVGVVFLYIGVFRLLTDVAGLPVWATFLIYAGAHLVTALVLLGFGMRMISGRDDIGDDEKAGEGVL